MTVSAVPPIVLVIVLVIVIERLIDYDYEHEHDGRSTPYNNPIFFRATHSAVIRTAKASSKASGIGIPMNLSRSLRKSYSTRLDSDTLASRNCSERPARSV